VLFLRYSKGLVKFLLTPILLAIGSILISISLWSWHWQFALIFLGLIFMAVAVGLAISEPVKPALKQ